MKIEPRSLQQRTLIYILLPTFVLLLALSFIGFIFVRDILISEWGKVAVSRLQRSADLIDARLREPKKLLLLLQQSDGSVLNPALANHIVREIESLDDVVKVNIEWPGRHEHADTGGEEFLERPRQKNRSLFLKRFQISSPEYDNGANSQTVSMVSEFKGMDDVTEGPC